MTGDANTFIAFVRGPISSEDDLLIRLLCDYGVVSASDPRTALAGVSTEALGDALHRFLLGLVPLRATAALKVENVRDLSPAVRNRIQALSALELDGRRLLHVDLDEDDGVQFATASWFSLSPVAGGTLAIVAAAIVIGLTVMVYLRFGH